MAVSKVSRLPLTGWVKESDRARNAIVDDGMDRSRLVPDRPHGQEAARFFHHDDILVLVKDRKAFGLVFRRRAFGGRHGSSLKTKTTGVVSCGLDVLCV